MIQPNLLSVAADHQIACAFTFTLRPCSADRVWSQSLPIAGLHTVGPVGRCSAYHRVHFDPPGVCSKENPKPYYRCLYGNSFELVID